MANGRPRQTSTVNMHSHSYHVGAAPSKPASGYGSSSAFSASANPDEDWTKITDLAERRRIQNRIAQRNYRKKLKRRLEDLEARAASTSPSPPHQHQELPASQAFEARLPQEYSHSHSATDSDSSYVSPELLSAGYYGDVPANGQQPTYFEQYPKEASVSRHGQWSCPPLEQAIYPAHSETSYPELPAASSAGLPMHAQYLPLMAPSLPEMTRPGSLAGDEALIYDECGYANHYAGHCGGVTELGYAPSQLDQGSNGHTPSLCDSFEFSMAGSPPDSGSLFPPTPFLSPMSPLLS